MVIDPVVSWTLSVFFVFSRRAQKPQQCGVLALWLPWRFRDIGVKNVWIQLAVQ
jgi:hypothetical protein